MTIASSAGGSGGFSAGTTRGRVASYRRSPLVSALSRRAVSATALLFLVSALTSVLLSLIPGDPTETILGPKHSSGAPLSQYHELAHQLGLDRSLPVRYWNWLWTAVHGDLGTSIISHQSVTHSIVQRLPVTVSLTVGALLVSLILGVSIGIVSAVRGGVFGRVVDALAVLGLVVPVFWIAAELVVLFAVKLRWFPAIGYVSFAESPGDWLRSLVLPVVALALAPVGSFAKFTRDAMLGALASEYVRMARANGASRFSIVFRHALKPSSLQIVTVAGIWVVNLLIGTVFVEKVFNLPGLGSLLVDSTYSKDLPVVQGVATFFTIIVIGVNFLIDLSYGVLSPRVRTR